MPGNVAAASPSTVMPEVLARSFVAASEFLIDVNEYADSSVQTKAITTTSRKTWRLAAVMDATLLGTMRTFWEARRNGEPFWFYFWREGAHDPTGLSTVGRYAAVFVGGWNEVTTLGRSIVELMIQEVA